MGISLFILYIPCTFHASCISLWLGSEKRSLWNHSLNMEGIGYHMYRGGISFHQRGHHYQVLGGGLVKGQQGHWHMAIKTVSSHCTSISFAYA